MGRFKSRLGLNRLHRVTAKKTDIVYSPVPNREGACFGSGPCRTTSPPFILEGQLAVPTAGPGSFRYAHRGTARLSGRIQLAKLSENIEKTLPVSTKTVIWRWPSSTIRPFECTRSDFEYPFLRSVVDCQSASDRRYQFHKRSHDFTQPSLALAQRRIRTGGC